MSPGRGDRMSVRVLFVSLIGVLLAISPWLPSRALGAVGHEAVAAKAHPTQICCSSSQAGHKTPSIDSGAGLWATNDPAFCKDETEQDEDEPTHTMALPPQGGQSEYPPINVTGLAQSFEGTAFSFRHIPLRC